jgi:ubiquinone/menaquinone biosynthesis C-methylase UbiE
MRRFLRRSSVQREPLAVTMTGARMGERVLQIGVGDARLTAQLAARPGISGHAAIVAADEGQADRARAVVAEAGALVDIHIAPLAALPLASGSFDLVVVHATSAQLVSIDVDTRARLFAECHRVLRPGGRIVVLDPGTPTGLAAMWRKGPAASSASATRPTADALESAGFRPVRLLADREGYRFFEGLKT